MKPGTSIFTEMASRKADLILFLGDFPYTARGGREEVRKGSRKLREVAGFAQLTASTPTYGIYDDHDFGPNDCDGTHPNADEALAAFKEYWPNPSYTTITILAPMTVTARTRTPMRRLRHSKNTGLTPHMAYRKTKASIALLLSGT
jgi:hypothetical protein